MSEKIDFGSVSYTLGVLSIILAFFTSYGLGGIVTGIVGLVIARKQKNARAKKINRIGIILGLFILVVSVLVTIYSINSGTGSFPLG